MLGIDDWLAGFGGGSVWLALAIAVVLGLRHATDPDHLTAVSTLVLCDDELGTRRAARLGFAWGLGHGTALLLLGLPVVALDAALPQWVQNGAQVAIGVVIVALAVRLIVRWRRGSFHAHLHRHDGSTHAHPHYHPHGAHTDADHSHPHGERFGRTPLTACGIGALHGAGGSAAAGILVVTAVPGTAAAALALVLFAAASALSMTLASMAWARVLVTPLVFRRLVALAPALGAGGVLFGCSFGLAAFA